MRSDKRRPRMIKTIMLMVMVAVVVNVAMIGYGVVWTWLKSTGFEEQNTVGIKPQEPPGSGAAVAAAVPTTGPQTRLTIKSAARALENPVSPNAESLRRGEERFNISCSPCHGTDGAGHGVMGTVPRLSQMSPKDVKDLQSYLRGFIGETPDIYGSFPLRLTDGELFFIITKGGEAIMPGYADALSEQQRWDVINYIKHSLGDNRGL